MRVVIVGAGAVGSYLAERLASEGLDVVVIESDPARAAELQEAVDCLVVTGNGASTEALAEAGVERADLFIAVSSSDAVNVLSANAAARLGSPRRIARVEDPRLRDEAEALGVDLLIDPGEATSKELLLLMQQRGISELTEFADGRLDLIGGFIAADAPVAGMSLTELRGAVKGWSWMIAAIIRDGETMIARGAMEIHVGDHVLVMAETEKADEAYRLLGFHEEPAQKVVILGTTRVAALTAAALSAAGIQTMLIDRDPDRVRTIAESTPKIVAICGDPTDPRVLQAENAANADAVLALTGWDETNILGCLVAKALGVRTAIARFHRIELVKLLSGVGIDAAVSSRLAAASAILRFVRRGRIHSVVTFQDSDVEALEVEIGAGSIVVERLLRDIHLPHDMIVGGVIRGTEAFVPQGDTEIMPGDRLIVIALPAAIGKVEQLSG